MGRTDKINEALKETVISLAAVNSSNKEWMLAHDAFNAMVTAQPRKGRNSGSALDNLWLHATAAYEALLDAMRVHSENVAHLNVLKGRG